MNNKTLAVIILVGVMSLSGLAFLTSGSTNTASPSATATPKSDTVNTPADAISAEEVMLKTSKGDVRLTLFPSEAPLAVTNFVTLGKRGYYDGIIFHRVIAGFMSQAGDPTGTGTGGESIYGRYFKTELNNIKFEEGVLGAARTAAMDTNGSQFFIMDQNTPALNNQYTAFGKVADAASLAVMKQINAVKTGANDKPIEPVSITAFEIIK